MTPRLSYETDDDFGAPGAFSTRADPVTGAPLLSGRCAKCEGEVKEGDPCGLFYLADAQPIDPALQLPVGLFHRMPCAPVGDPRYIEEEV